jgi:hypothetical protein
VVKRYLIKVWPPSVFVRSPIRKATLSVRHFVLPPGAEFTIRIRDNYVYDAEDPPDKKLGEAHLIAASPSQ